MEEFKSSSGEATAPALAVDSALTEHPFHLPVAPGRIIATAIVLAICYFAELPIVVLLASILLAFALVPVVDFFMLLRLPRWLAALAAVFLMMAIIGGVLYASYSRAQGFVQQLPQLRKQIRTSISHLEHKAAALTGEEDGENVSNPPPPAHARPELMGWLTSSLGPLTEVIFSASLIPFLVYFMITWQPHVRAATVMLFPLQHRNTAYVTLGLISSMLRAFIMGNIIIGLFIGTLSMMVFASLGLPYFYFLGLLSGYASLLPYVGIPLAILPPVILGLGKVHSADFVIIVLAVIGLHLLAMNVLYPKLLGKRLSLNPLAVALSLLFWGWLWGAVGMVLAMPITAALKIVFDHVESLRPYGTWLGI